MKRQGYGFMNSQAYNRASDCDKRIAVLEAMIKAHKSNAKDGIGTFKMELAAIRSRKRELSNPPLPFGQPESLNP